METTIQKAQRQGITLALKATVLAEISIALLFFTFLLSATGSVQMFYDVLAYLGVYNFALFVLSSLLFAYMIGKNAGVKVLVRKKRHVWVGIFSGLKVVLFSTIICIVAVLVLQGANGALEKGWLLHYIMKPFAWMAVLCLVPVLIAGMWYGYTLHQKAKG